MLYWDLLLLFLQSTFFVLEDIFDSHSRMLLCIASAGLGSKSAFVSPFDGISWSETLLRLGDRLIVNICSLAFS